MSRKVQLKAQSWPLIALLFGVTHCGTSESTATTQPEAGTADGTSGSMTATHPDADGGDAGGREDGTSGSMTAMQPDDAGGDDTSASTMKPGDGGGDVGIATADAQANDARAASPDADLIGDGPARDAGGDAASCHSNGDCASDQLCVSLISCPTILCSPPVITSTCNANPCDGGAACNPCAALCSNYTKCVLTDAGTMVCGSVPGAGGG